MKSNTVTISQSCLSELPPGEYHYSVFNGIDIFKQTETPESLKTQIADLESDLRYTEKEIQQLREQLEFARELVEVLKQLQVSKAAKKAIESAIENSQFEV